MFRIQYISDIHLEKMNRAIFSKLVRPVSGTLALAGNIGYPNIPLYPQFIEYCKKNWDEVIVVPGTHEFDQGFKTQMKLMREICSQWSNVHFLYNESIYLDKVGVNFCGTTLWTPYTKPNLHKEAVAWLDSALYMAEMDNLNTVVVSHHRPSRLMTNSYSRFQELETTNLEDMISWPIRAWISGHNLYQKEITLQIDDPPTEEGEIVLGINAYAGGGHPERSLEFPLLPPPHAKLIC
jgi:hypothetical protein